MSVCCQSYIQYSTTTGKIGFYPFSFSSLNHCSGITVCHVGCLVIGSVPELVRFGKLFVLGLVRSRIGPGHELLWYRNWFVAGVGGGLKLVLSNFNGIAPPFAQYWLHFCSVGPPTCISCGVRCFANIQYWSLRS